MRSAHASTQPAGTTPLLIFQSELAAIEAETLRWPDLETGGELFGYFTFAGWPVVHLVVNANAAARREAATFHPDADQIDRAGRELINRYGLQHLGQWHSHHRIPLTHPSGVDKATVAEAIRTYRLGSFVQVIANIRPRDGADGAMAHGYFYRERQPDQCEPMPWLVLPGTSPIRALSDGEHPQSPTIQLEPRVVTWRELSGQSSEQVLKDGDVPITDQALLTRLGEELRLLDAAGVVARGRPAGRQLRIDATHAGRRFAILLTPDFPTTPPTLHRLFDDAPDVLIEFPWTPQRRIVELLTEPTSGPEQEKPTRSKGKMITGVLRLIGEKQRKFGAFLSTRAGSRRKGG